MVESRTMDPATISEEPLGDIRIEEDEASMLNLGDKRESDDKVDDDMVKVDETIRKWKGNAITFSLSP